MTINIARTFALSVVSAGIIGHPDPADRPGLLVRPGRHGQPCPAGAARLARPPRCEPHRAPGSRLPPL